MNTLDAASRETIISAVNRFLTEREVLGLDEQRDWAPVFARQALQLAAALCGPQILQGAFGANPDPNDRAAGLIALSDRLSTVAHFFASCSDAGANSSIEAVALEAYLVASGDKPKLFSPLANRPGKRGNAAALAHLQLKAFEWEAFMEGADLVPGERQALVAAAYGQTWAAMVKWKNVLSDRFGDETVKYMLDVARRSSRLLARPISVELELNRMRLDGATYKRLLGFGS